MITHVGASAGTFKDVDLSPGFNVVLAERTQDPKESVPAGTKKSTNGSGKTLLLEICQFCLGADMARSPLADDELEEWAFTITMTIRGRDYRVTRRNSQPTRIVVQGDFSGWLLLPRRDPDTEELFFTVDDWTASLGSILYELEFDTDETKFRPSFRTLFSYAARRNGRVWQSIYIFSRTARLATSRC